MLLVEIVMLLLILTFPRVPTAPRMSPLPFTSTPSTLMAVEKSPPPMPAAGLWIPRCARYAISDHECSILRGGRPTEHVAIYSVRTEYMPRFERCRAF
jgi:hypothetical protein